MDPKPGPSHTLMSIGETVENIPVTEAVEKDQDTRHTALSKTLSTLRYTVFNTYRRLFTIVVITNITTLVVILVRKRHVPDIINACAANLLACGLARQPLVVNSLYFIFGLVPRSAPLRLRHLACKIFHIGGVHSGCGVASLLWYLGFVALYSYNYHSERSSSKSPGASSTAILVVSWVIFWVFVSVIAVTYPVFRTRHHNVFELVHRFGGWAIHSLFWALLPMYGSSAQADLGHALATLPAFWCLLVATIATIHPWAMLRQVPVVTEPLSSHATRLHLSHTSVVFGKGISLSRHPLRDWHSFATITDRFDSHDTKFSCVISRAGDWTTNIIENPPTKIWVRGVPITGFAYAMRVFSRIVLVTTGSGIGPCLSFIEDEQRPSMRVAWQTRDPLATYGQRTLNLVQRLDPNPMIIETKKRSGRIDMLPLVEGLYEEFAAEAVCIVSNPVLTRTLVFQLESRGIRAYGPIFDR